ncbi:hypothetical protein [Caballeronia sp. LZ035]|uniref:hypothetical protein n=1 Tax=Caballeronia sp. LZ035 TaxID=3038568 RepID=UPI00285B9D7D|nr:hypothetical protein [Caballeronia sp. LZ035]MDR5761956.1 hypothetical protein [Caballeronia sp. LZ035]
MLTKEQLLSLGQPTVETVNVEGLGEIRVKVMDGFARDALQKTLQEQGTSDSVYFSAVIVATVVDDKGAPMFTTADLDTLRGMSAETVRRIGLACTKVNALGTSQAQEAEKN